MASEHSTPLGNRYGSAGGQEASALRDEVTTKARRAAETAREQLGRGYHSVEQAVVTHPGVSALAMFGLGVGVGLLIGSALGAEHERSRSLSARWIDSRRAEKFGRQVLDSLGDYLPNSISSRLS